jgi:hypothetical protein
VTHSIDHATCALHDDDCSKQTTDIRQLQTKLLDSALVHVDNPAAKLGLLNESLRFLSWT